MSLRAVFDLEPYYLGSDGLPVLCREPGDKRHHHLVDTQMFAVIGDGHTFDEAVAAFGRMLTEPTAEDRLWLIDKLRSGYEQALAGNGDGRWFAPAEVPDL